MTDLIDSFATPEPETPPTADMPPPDADGAPAGADPNSSPHAQPAPEGETDEQWRLRFIEENQHLLPPRAERPPAPPPSPWDGPPSTWKVPDHLSLRHPKGGYMAMALMSRTMDDLDEVTKGERAATYEEVDKYLGHALIAEGLVPFTYTPDEAIRWWKSGGYKVLGSSTEAMPNLPRNVSATDETLMTDDTAPDETLQAQDDAQTRPPEGMNFRGTNGTMTDGMAIDNVIDPSQSGTAANVPAGQQNPATMPASQPAAPATTAPAAPGPEGKQATVQPAGPAKGAVKPIVTPISLGKRQIFASNQANRITGAYLPQSDFIAALQNGLLSSVEPDTRKGKGGLNNDRDYQKATDDAPGIPAIANIDISADPEAIAFVKAIAPVLAKSRVGGKNRRVEKYLMVEWDSSTSRYVVTAIKILPALGGSVIDLKPRFPENVAVWGKSRPRAFVIHTHTVGDGFSEVPGPRDANVVKSWLVPNFVVEENAKSPVIHQVTMIRGETNPKTGQSNAPEIGVGRMMSSGVFKATRYAGMPK